MDIESGQLREIFWHLPEPSKAQYLIRIYYHLGAWMYAILHTHEGKQH